MCKYCEWDEVLLSSGIELLDNFAFYRNEKTEQVYIKKFERYIETELIQVFYDSRGYLRLTLGDDINCLDYSKDKIKINYCPMCGRKLCD